MRTSPAVAFAAGVIVGAVGLGAVAAHARIVLLNLQVGGIPPGTGASMFCVTPSNAVRAVAGTTRVVSVNAAGGGTSVGTELRCPS